MIKTLVPVDPSGRMVIPKAVRRQLNLEKGGVCSLRLTGNKIELTPADSAGRKLRKVGRFLIAEATGRAASAVEDIDSIRQERL